MKKLLVALDFSDVTERVTETAATLARDLGAAVFLFHATPPSAATTAYGITIDHIPSVIERERQRAEKLLTEYQARFAEQSIQAEPLILQGPASESILRAAKQKNVDMIILGSHGHGALYEFIVGSTARGVMRKFPKPVVLVPART